MVWVGLDDNMPLGLSGTQAALPIWTTFMMRALAGRPNVSFEAPDGLVYVDIDRDTGKLATPAARGPFRGLHRRHRADRDVPAARRLRRLSRLSRSRAPAVYNRTFPLAPFSVRHFTSRGFTF